MPRVFVALVLISACMSGQSAQADIVTFNATPPSIQIGTASSANMSLRQFDPSLGTLTSVSISGAVNISGAGIGTNSNPPGTPVGGSATESFTLTLSNAALGINQALAASLTVSGGTNSPGPFGLAGTGSRTMTTITDTSAANFAVYRGTGTIPLTFSTSNFAVTNPNSSAGTSLGSFGGSLSGGNIAIAYTFTPAAVPEPSSMAFLGLALGGAGWRSWRKRQRSEQASA